MSIEMSKKKELFKQKREVKAVLPNNNSTKFKINLQMKIIWLHEVASGQSGAGKSAVASGQL